MTRPRAADDFAMIRARMGELRRERAQATSEKDQRTMGPQSQRGADAGLAARGLRRSGLQEEDSWPPRPPRR